MGILRLFAPQTTFDPKNPDQYFQTDHIKAEIKGRTVRGGVVTATSQLLKQSLSLGSVIVLARLLSPQDTGLVAMVTVITGFIEHLNDFGLSAATVQRDEINQRQVSTLFWINVAFGTVLSLVTAGLAPAISSFYGEPRLTLITLVTASMFFFTGLTYQHRALLRRQMLFTSLAMIDVMSIVVSVTVAIGAALAGFGYWSLVFMRLAAVVTEMVGAWAMCPWRPTHPTAKSGVRSMLSFGSYLVGFRIIHYVARHLDNLLIGRFYGAAQLGLYVRAYGLLLLPLIRINEPFSGVAWPALARLIDSPQRYRQAYTSIVSKVCLITMPLVAFMVGTADWSVLVLLGPQWAEASRIFAWLGVSGLVEPFSSTTGWLFLSQGRARDQFRWSIISTPITVTSILIGLPWGPVGVAAAYGIVGLLIRMPLLFWFVGRSGPVTTKDLYRTLAPFACVSCAVLLSLFIFRQWAAGPTPLVNLIVGAGITGVVSLIVLAVLPSGRIVLRDLKRLPALLGIGKSAA